MQWILNFHGIGEPRREIEPGEESVWISAAQFEQVLDLVQASAIPVGLTFDDANASDYAIAVPALRERGLRATFFVLAGRLDQPGSLTSSQISEIDADPLFTIGSHGMHHRPWPELSDGDLNDEIVGSRNLLSEICGRPIDQAGLPFGRYDRRTLRLLESSGYNRVYSSDGAPRMLDRNPIARLSLRKEMTLQQIAAFVNREWPLARLVSEMRALAKSRR